MSASLDIVDRLEFDSNRCASTFSKGVASNIDEAIVEIRALRETNLRLARQLVDVAQALTAFATDGG